MYRLSGCYCFWKAIVLCNQVRLDEGRAERLARTELPHFPERPGGIFYHKDKDPKYKLYLKISTILWNLHSGYLWIWCLALEWLGLSTDSQVMKLTIIMMSRWWSLIVIIKMMMVDIIINDDRDDDDENDLIFRFICERPGAALEV